MADSKYHPSTVKLFERTFPVLYQSPIDYPIQTRSTPAITGLGSVLSLVKSDSMEFGDYENKDICKEKKLKLKVQTELDNLQKNLISWNPENDPHVTGDPYKTIFIARLDYSISEIDLTKQFSSFGEIEKVRVVRDKRCQKKSKGYGFIIYKNSRDAKIALQNGNGMLINNREIIADTERGRVVKNWRPRRLGGGLGGRHYTKPRWHFTGARSRSADFSRQNLHPTSSSIAQTTAITTRNEIKYTNTSLSTMSSMSNTRMYTPPASYWNLNWENDGRPYAPVLAPIPAPILAPVPSETTPASLQDRPAYKSDYNDRYKDFRGGYAYRGEKGGGYREREVGRSRPRGGRY